MNYQYESRARARVRLGSITRAVPPRVRAVKKLRITRGSSENSAELAAGPGIKFNIASAARFASDINSPLPSPRPPFSSSLAPLPPHLPLFLACEDSSLVRLAGKARTSKFIVADRGRCLRIPSRTFRQLLRFPANYRVIEYPT